MSAPDIECADVWHPGTLSDAAALAYKLLEAQGRIAIQRVEVGQYSEQVTVRYLADIPHEWVLELLSKAKQEIQETKEDIH